MAEIRNPDFRSAAAAIFTEANFIADLGIEPLTIDHGRVAARLTVLPRHLQHSGVIHAGVQMTLADHTAGAAGHTVIDAEQMVLTCGFTVQLLAPAVGAELLARAEILRGGRRLVYAETSVFTWQNGRERLVSRAQVTLAVRARPPQSTIPQTRV